MTLEIVHRVEGPLPPSHPESQDPQRGRTLGKDLTRWVYTEGKESKSVRDKSVYNSYTMYSPASEDRQQRKVWYTPSVIIREKKKVLDS